MNTTFEILLFILLQADNPPNSTAEIILAIGSVLGIIGGIISPFILFYLNKIAGQQVVMATKVDGLLEQKTLADKAIGAKDERDTRDRQDASENVGKLKVYQQNRDAVTEVKEIKEVIVKTVEKKADETKEVVEKIPDEVVKKLPPKE